MRHKLKKPILLLASLGLLTGCAKTQLPAPIAAESLCRSWKHQTISPADQLADSTAAGIEGNNKARPAWGCEYGKDRAQEAPAKVASRG